MHSVKPQPAREYRAASSDDRGAIVELLRWSFRISAEDAELWIDRAGLASVRVLQVGERVGACLILRRSGLFLGERPVSSGTIAAVASAPELRGTGLMRELLQASLRELASAGASTVALYPSTRALYRQVGFEVAGARYSYRAPLERFTRGTAASSMRAVEHGDFAAVQRLYQRTAAPWNGPLDRDAYLWSRLTEHPRRLVKGFVFAGDGTAGSSELEAYVYLHEVPGSGDAFRYELRINDYAFSTPHGLAALQRFLAGHGSIATHVTWDGGPADPLVHALETAEYTTSQSPSHWMLRILDVQRALTERGYPRSLECHLELEVSDPLFAANHGRFLLHVSNGEGTATRGGSGALKMSIQGLATLLTSHSPPSVLQAAGALTAPPDQLELAKLTFMGPSPWMREAF